jgi:hypothetical protein
VERRFGFGWQQHARKKGRGLHLTSQELPVFGDAFDGAIVGGLLGSASDEIVFQCDDGVIVIARE